MEEKITKEIYQKLEEIKKLALKLKNEAKSKEYMGVYMTVSEGVELIKENIGFLCESRESL